MRGEVIFKQKEQQRQGPRVKSSTAHILCSHSSHEGEITPSAMQWSHPDKNHLPSQVIFPAHIYLREMQGWIQKYVHKTVNFLNVKLHHITD